MVGCDTSTIVDRLNNIQLITTSFSAYELRQSKHSILQENMNVLPSIIRAFNYGKLIMRVL